MIINTDNIPSDVDKCIAYIGDKLSEILYDIVGVYNQSWVNIGNGNHCFDRVMYGYNLTTIAGQYAFPKNPKIDIIKYWESVFWQSYLYANGEDIQDINNVDEFLELAARCLLLARGSVFYASLRAQTRWHDIDKLQDYVSVNYGLAVAKVQARQSFITAVNHAKKNNQPAVTSPKILATLGNVTQGYILQLTSNGVLPASKKGGVWEIDVLVGLDWLQGRDCPDWIKRL